MRAGRSFSARASSWARRALHAVAPFLVVALAPSRAVAAGETEAEGLFTQGRTLLEQGRFAEACPKLQKSEELAPAVGTLLNLGYCWEQLRRFRSAMDAYAEAEVLAERANDTKRKAFAREHLVAAEARVMKLVVRIADAKTEGLEVRRNDAPLPPSQWGQPIPVDPDDIVVSATAPGRIPWKGIVSVSGEGGVTTVVVPPLEERPPRAGLDLLGGRRLVALGLGAGAVVALSAGVATALAAKARHDDATPLCPATGCDPVGHAIRDRAASESQLAIGLVVLGTLGAAAGVYLWVSGGDAPPRAREKKTSAHVGVGLSGVFASGTF